MDTPQTPNSHTMCTPQEGSSTTEDQSALPQESREMKRLHEENEMLKNQVALSGLLAKTHEDKNNKQEKPWLLKVIESNLRLTSPDNKYAQLKADHDKLAADYEELKGRCDKMSSINQELRQRKEMYKSVSAQLRSKIETQAINYTDLQRAFDDKSKKFDELWKTWQDTVEELQEAKKFDEKYEVDDDIVIAKWKSLCYAIRSTAHQAFKTTIPSKFPASMVGWEFKETSSRYMEYLTKEDRVPLIYGAVIWRLVSQYLRRPLRAYDFNADRALSTLETQIHASEDEEEIRKVHDWRSVTGEIFETMKGTDEKYKDLLIRTLFKLLSPRSSLPEEEFGQHVKVMVDKTLELAGIFARSRAWYRVWDGPTQKPHDFIADGFPLDVTCMEECGGDGSGDVVDIILSPALIKHGNGEGEDYGEYLVLAKADIISRR